MWRRGSCRMLRTGFDILLITHTIFGINKQELLHQVIINTVDALLITSRCLWRASVGDCAPHGGTAPSPRFMSSPTDQTPLPVLLRDARRSMGITQAELARRVECTQSAVSMMEKGRPDAVARPTLEKIASILGVELPAEGNGSAPHPSPAPPFPSVRICPNEDCPSNLPYRVGEGVHFMPHAHRGSATRCPYCGEVLVGVCETCGEPVRAGEAFCSGCGAPHVVSTLAPGEASDAWLRNRQEQSRLVLGWSRAAEPL